MHVNAHSLLLLLLLLPASSACSKKNTMRHLHGLDGFT
jgi:hypothetical protein